jgi:anti-sigma factor RsiW
MSECKQIDPFVTPYVDGELADTDRQRIDHHLGKCPPCHSRIAAERAVRDAIQSRRGEIARSCAPASLRVACARLAGVKARATADGWTDAQTVRRAPWATRLAPFALAASLALIVGGAFVYRITDSSATVLAAELTADHVKCFAMNAMLGTHQAPTAVESAMFAGFGWQMHLPENPAQLGLELVGSRPCLYGEGKIAHMMYRHQGNPVSLFMLPKSTRAEEVVEVLGHEAKIWCVGNRTLVLIAREPRRQVEQLAAFMQASIH